MDTDSDGGFLLVKKDGEPSHFVYQPPKYNHVPQTQSSNYQKNKPQRSTYRKYKQKKKTQCSTSSGEPPNHDHPHKHLFLCPLPRYAKSKPTGVATLIVSPEYIFPTTKIPLDKTSNDLDDVDHPVLPLYWCNNKEFDVDGGCSICSGLNFGTDYYFCEYHDKIYHKECVESPLKIKHPTHPHHFFQLILNHPDYLIPLQCFVCGKKVEYLTYISTVCGSVMHTLCAMKMIPFVVDTPKRHEHPLTFFPRQNSIPCNVCGFVKKDYPTYVCLMCSFVAHNDCMYYPSIIKISRHKHRLSYVSSVKLVKWSCGVCRQHVNGDYGLYACDKCDCYVVHPRCALRKDVWDGKELEGVIEKDDIAQDAAPYDTISEGVILHFLHDHHLKLEVNKLYDENKFCQGCVLPIFQDEYYSCMECGFFLHETCARARRRVQHELHPHPLTLIDVSAGYNDDVLQCGTCMRICGGFAYLCPMKECDDFGLDMRCASMSEPFGYKGHEHPLFLSLDPEEKPTCQVCKSECVKQFDCLKCDFIICFTCATIPYNVRYKHDKHFLTLLWGEKVCEKDWCELCERNLEDTSTKFFYWCEDCCTTLHVACLLGEDPYMKPGQFGDDKQGTQFQILRKSNLARPFCDSCKYPCQGNIFSIDNRIVCSFKCLILTIQMYNLSF